MTYAIYNRDTGALLDLSDSIKEVDLPVVCEPIAAPDLARETWSLTMRLFVPKTVTVITKLEYLRRFTSQERVTIRTVAKSNPVLEDYLAMLDIAEEINLSDADTVAAVQMLEQAGLIASGRAAEILG